MDTEITMSRDWANNLPKELLSLISSKILTKEAQLAFRLTCRSWKAVVPQFHHYPYLMSYEVCRRKWKIFQYDNISYMDFPELHNSDIRCSKYGWLLMSGRDWLPNYCKSLFFFNPSNKQRIDIPNGRNFYETIDFFNLPTSSDCLVVGMSQYIVEIGLLERGDEKWTKFQDKTESPDFVPAGCSPVLHRGQVYFLDVCGEIGTFDIHNKIWKIYENCLPSLKFCTGKEENYLIKLMNGKSQEQLYGVFVAYEDIDDDRIVKVCRLLEPEKKWELIEDLGDKVLFVSNTGSFGGIAPLKNMANKIYFPKLHGESGVFYSLDTKKYQSYDGDFSSNNSYGLKDINFATWVMPTFLPSN